MSTVSAIDVNDTTIIKQSNIDTGINSITPVNTSTSDNNITNEFNDVDSVSEFNIVSNPTVISKEKTKIESSSNVNVVLSVKHKIGSQINGLFNIKPYHYNENNLIKGCILPKWIKDIHDFVYGPGIN